MQNSYLNIDAYIIEKSCIFVFEYFKSAISVKF